MDKCPFHDAFAEHRKQGDAIPITFDDEEITMILGFKAVRSAARDFGSFSSDAPFRVPIPSEEDVRTVRQLPIELDPPKHKAYRALVEPFFRRPLAPEYAEKVSDLIEELLLDASGKEHIEIVRNFALPLQSRALTYLFNVDESEAEIWTGWGIHVFRDGKADAKDDFSLEDYINRKFDEAEASPEQPDFFSTLAYAVIEGERLTRDEMVGFANLAFAGGRDTIIQSVSSVFALFGMQPELLNKIRSDSSLINTATEEFFRMVTPLTHIGRVNTENREVHGVETKQDQRISLCWASANYDETVFKNADTFCPDRKPNLHIAFGNGAHTCAGAHHARLIMRTLLRLIADLNIDIKLIDLTENIEKQNDYERRTGFESLIVKLNRTTTNS